MHKYYSIANINLEFVNFPRLYNRYWEKFESIEPSKIKIEYVKAENVSYNLEQYHMLEEYDICFRYKKELLLVDREWVKNTILQVDNIDSIFILLNQIFYTHAVQRHMIQIHSSMIDYQGKGLLFLGPSGIGKTTMAELWNKYKNALIINGDMNFVQETDKCFLGWGTPWHGSSPYCENANVPVHALIVLRQASENSIRELENFEKVQSVSNNIIYPTWLENGMELCLETLDHLLTALPVYELSCRPDEDAVRLTEEKIFGNL